ncbi:hypothetical protein H5P28_19545 [Ruficoccus amylovorans]|uniref:Uncharacterized protein n=1 Tax=Ruficoccus amylovorans TaxID=1804625 RepID=A0A842HJA2_9BACT|nr:hypothetical protein [Ruficoccus amylovorans]MBC2596469.1 hypothetical protein [Ruficoccus amylovorans]
MGISNGWLNVNACDAGVGLFAVAEGSADLMQAFSGTLDMGAWTFVDTFVEGGVEVVLGCWLENPFLLAGGIENVLAGVVSAWKTFSVYVDPQSFFGASLTSALIGLTVGYGIAGQSPSEALTTALRSGVVGGLFSVSAAFGFGAIGGLLACLAGRALARRHQMAADRLLTVDATSLGLLLEELEQGSPDFPAFLRSLEGRLLVVTARSLPEDQPALAQACLRLPCEPDGLVGCCRSLRADGKGLHLLTAPREELFPTDFSGL